MIIKEKTQEDFCSNEVSKLLKEKGFDWDCVACYNKDGDLLTIYDNTIGGVAPADWNHMTREEYGRIGLAAWYGNISCPTSQVALRWLRKKYNIIIVIDYNEDEGCEINERWGFTVFVNNCRNVDLATYPTPEETVDAALKYALKKLI